MRKKEKKDDDATMRRYAARVPYFCKSIFPLFKYGVLIAVMSAHFFTSSTDAARVALVPHLPWTTMPPLLRRCDENGRRRPFLATTFGSCGVARRDDDATQQQALSLF